MVYNDHFHFFFWSDTDQLLSLPPDNATALAPTHFVGMRAREALYLPLYRGMARVRTWYEDHDGALHCGEARSAFAHSTQFAGDPSTCAEPPAFRNPTRAGSMTASGSP